MEGKTWNHSSKWRMLTAVKGNGIENPKNKKKKQETNSGVACHLKNERMRMKHRPRLAEEESDSAERTNECVCLPEENERRKFFSGNKTHRRHTKFEGFSASFLSTRLNLLNNKLRLVVSILLIAIENKNHFLFTYRSKQTRDDKVRRKQNKWRHHLVSSSSLLFLDLTRNVFFFFFFSAEHFLFYSYLATSFSSSLTHSRPSSRGSFCVTYDCSSRRRKKETLDSLFKLEWVPLLLTMVL